MDIDDGRSSRLRRRHASPAGRIAFLILLTAIGLGVGAAVSAAEGTTARAQAQIVAFPASGTLPVDTGTVEPFTQTVRSLLTSNAVATLAARDVGSPGSATEITDHLSLSSPPESSAIDVNYDASSTGRAVVVLGAVLNEFEQLLRTQLPAVHGTVPIRITVFDQPHPVASVGPHWLRNLAFGGVAGFLLGLALLYARDAYRRKDVLEIEVFEDGREPGARAAPETGTAVAAAPPRP